jgi:hypothetical protein
VVGSLRDVVSTLPSLTAGSRGSREPREGRVEARSADPRAAG